MRIHSDTIQPIDFVHAAEAASNDEDGAVFLHLSEHGSRKRARAFEVGLEGDGTKNRRRRNPGSGDNDNRNQYAATWDAWGRFFAYLYAIDPNMIAGWAYKNATDFHDKTHGQFE